MTCEICGKRHMSGNKVSHSNIKTRTRQNANVQKVRAVVNGRNTRVNVCTRCLRSNKIAKAI
ncbi:MAG: 50S ribosomal protein L28 [Deltaproteobacteria bacterium]|nr:50S ribosomal protein L28 [Deltaproteobacteria bacterium]